MGKQDIFDTTAIFDDEYEVRSKLTHNILLELKFLFKRHQDHDTLLQYPSVGLR